MRHAIFSRMSYLLMALLVLCASGVELQARQHNARTAASKRKPIRRRKAVVSHEVNKATPPVPVGNVVIGDRDVENVGPVGPVGAAPAATEPNAPANQRHHYGGGVLNAKALSLPQPPYPPIARAARAQGTVVVQVVVDEDGKVIAATAITGHPLLRQAAVNAARQARFSPTILSGQPVKVSGVITYNFVLK